MPLAPAVMVIHETALLAVHVHPDWVVRETLPVPAAAGAVALVGVTVELHATPACVTVNV